MFVWWHPLSTHSCKCCWKFCIICMVGEIPAASSLMLCFKSTVVLGLFLYTLFLRYPQREKSQALRSGNLAGHSVFPLCKIMQAGNITLRTCTAILGVRCSPVLLKPGSLGFNTKSLQLQFQKYAKHLSVAG